MIEPVVITPTMMRSVGDCGVTCLAMLLEKSYAEIIRACPRKLSTKHIIEEGLTVPQMCNVARKLGAPLDYHDHNFEDDFEEDPVGILYLERIEGEDAHAALFLKGVVYNPATGELWTDMEAFLERGKWKVEGLLTRRSE